MTSFELRNFAVVMKEFGIYYLKNGDTEIHMSDRPSLDKTDKAEVINAPSEDNNPIQHKVEEMVSLLKMDDNDLLDTLFPDTHPPQEEAV